MSTVTVVTVTVCISDGVHDVGATRTLRVLGVTVTVSNSISMGICKCRASQRLSVSVTFLSFQLSAHLSALYLYMRSAKKLVPTKLYIYRYILYIY